MHNITWWEAVFSLMFIYDGSVLMTRERDIAVARELIRLRKEPHASEV